MCSTRRRLRITNCNEGKKKTNEANTIPVIEDRVHPDVIFGQDAILGLLVLDQDVPVIAKSAIANAPFPPVKCRWVLVQDGGVVGCAQMQASIVDDDA